MNISVKDQKHRNTELKRCFFQSEKKTIIQMAKRLGLFNKRSNPWADLVRSLYEKRFGVGSL